MSLSSSRPYYTVLGLKAQYAALHDETRAVLADSRLSSLSAAQLFSPAFVLCSGIPHGFCLADYTEKPLLHLDSKRFTLLLLPQGTHFTHSSNVIALWNVF